MSGLVFSELSQLVLQDHRRRDASGGVQVLPVVCADITPTSPDCEVLAAAISAEDGQIFVAEQLSAGVEGVMDRLGETIEGFVDPEEPTRPRLRLSEDSGEVRTEFLNGSVPPWSKGNENLAGAMLAPFSSQLRQVEIAVVAYDENTLDASAADAIWQLYCLHLPKHDLGHLRTLVLVCYTANLVPTRHCQKFNSARFVVTPERVSRRREWEVDKQEIRRLGEEAENPIVLFLGAGFSSSSQTATGDLPMGNELRDRALRRLVGGFKDEVDAAAKFRAFCEGRGTLLPGESEMSVAEFQRTLTFERVLHLELAETADELGPTLGRFRDEVEEAKKVPGESLLKLNELLEAGKRLILVTVNLDELVEQVCGGLVEAFATEESFTVAPAALQAYLDGEDRPAPLLKLHGSLGEPKSIIATVGSVAKGLPGAKTDSLDCLLGASGQERRLWFYVGASMRDRDVLQHVGARRFGERLDEWWVAPVRDQSVEKFIRDSRNQVWKEMGLEFGAFTKCITTTADIFMGEAVSVLR